MKKKPKMMPVMLRLWTPEMENSAGFLYFLSRELSPDWWKQREGGLKIGILHEIKRIDDGRGIINNWLASIIRKENDTTVLDMISPWNWRENPYPAVLLKAWGDKINNGRNKPSVRSMALKIITGPDLSPEKFSAEKPPENEELKNWGERERRAIISEYLTGNMKPAVEELEIIARAMAMPEVYGENVFNALLRQWNARMRECAARISDNEDWLPLTFRMDAEKAVRKKIWEGIIAAASYCPAAIDIVQPWVEYWLPRETDLEILNLMADWQPAGELAQKRLIELWKPYLFPRKEDEPSGPAACEKIQWAAWQFMWKTVSRQKKSNRKWEGIGNNCLEVMHLFLKTVHASGDNMQYLPEILAVIETPDELVPQQQAAWNNLWLEWLQSSNGQVVKTAVIHLFQLAAERLILSEEVQGAVFKRLTSATSWEIVGDLLKGLQAGKNVDSKILETGWIALHQSAGWKCPKIRLTAVKELTEHLDNIWFDGKERPFQSELSEFYLNILQNDPDPEVIFHLGEREFFWWRWGQKSNPDRAPGFFRKSGAIWRKRLHDPEPGIRQVAWEILNQRGEISGTDLVQCLSREQNWDVLCVMSDWTPRQEEGFPPEFWEKWSQSILRVSRTMDVEQGEWKAIRRPGRLYYVPENIFFIAEKIGKILVATRFSKRMEEGSRWENDLNGMETFWEKLIAEFPKNTRIHRAREQYKILHTMLVLDSAPEVFQAKWSKLSRTERYTLGRDMDELLASFPDFVLMRKNQEESDRNIICNLVTVMEERMDDKKAIESETFRKTMVHLWNCELWPPEQMPPGWARFCEILEKETDPERFVRLIQMGRDVKDFRCRRILQQMMESMRQSGKSLKGTLAEYVICCDLAVECENLGRYAPQGRTVDEVTEWRWLRQSAHSHPDLLSGAKMSPRTVGNKKGGKVNIQKTVPLANCLAECIYPKALRDKRRKTEKTGMQEKMSFFCDLQEIGIIPPKPEQSAGGNVRSMQGRKYGYHREK